MHDNLHILIDAAVRSARQRRAAHLTAFNDAISLAKATETSLGEIAERYGDNSTEMRTAATAVAAEMLNIMIEALNTPGARITERLIDANKVTAYIDRLPLEHDFSVNRYGPQRQTIKDLMRRYRVNADDLLIDYAPTIGDDGSYKACKSIADYRRYLHRHTCGKHADEAREQIKRLAAKRKAQADRRNMAFRALLWILGLSLVVAVCLVLEMSPATTIGIAILTTAAMLMLSFMRTFGREMEGDRKRKRLIYGALTILLATVGTVSIFSEARHQQRVRLDQIISENDEDAIMSYLSDSHNTYYRREALQAYLSMMDSIFFNADRMSKPTQMPPLARMANFSKSEDLPEDMRKIIHQRVKERTDSLYRQSVMLNTLSAWSHYQALAPSEFYYDSSEKIDSIETVSWSTEANAWETAKNDDTREAYNKYIEMYPHGAHASAANSRLIDFEVSDYRNQGQVTLDNITKILDYDGPGSHVYIYNNSDYSVRMLFSGPTSTSLSLRPKGYEERDIADGIYQVLVLIDNPGEDRFSFTQTFEHGIYSSNIEIKTKSSKDD